MVVLFLLDLELVARHLALVEQERGVRQDEPKLSTDDRDVVVPVRLALLVGQGGGLLIVGTERVLVDPRAVVLLFGIANPALVVEVLLDHRLVPQLGEGLETERTLDTRLHLREHHVVKVTDVLRLLGLRHGGLGALRDGLGGRRARGGALARRR